MVEKQRRIKAIRDRKEAEARALEYASSKTDEADTPPEIPSGSSLVLDPTHCLSDLILKRARYKVYWGGRGSAKSWGIAEAIIRRCNASPLRVLCTREIQKTIKDSSHKLLIDTIKRLGVEGWWNWNDERIWSKSGAEIMFKGLNRNEQGIKSTEGIDICWVEEAQTVTAGSWRTLTPTIRKDGSEIWVSYNLIDEEDATHQRFVIKGRSNAIVHKINYDSNPYFSGELREEMEDDRRTDYHLYEHIWLGMPLKISNAIVYSGKYRVEDFDANLWKHADRRRLGLDHGFAQDPLALVSMFVLGRKLYIEREAYATGVDIDEIPKLFDECVPEARDWPIKADSARPETNSYLRKHGFQVYGAEKWDGCVKDGITHIRRYEEIIVHPRCTNTAREFRLYRYKTDPKLVDEKGQPIVLPIIIDKNNHAMDAIRYGHDGEIQHSGSLGQWARLGNDGEPVTSQGDEDED